MFNGYGEAEVLDTMLENLLINYPITKENVREWMKLTRTVQTSLDILSHDIQIARSQSLRERE